MADNYHNTIYRMYDSSDALFKIGQWFNANYLAGYVLECYCKLILLLLRQQGNAYPGNTQNIRSFGHSLSNLKDELALISLEGYPISEYCLDIQNICQNMLDYWNPARRYEPDTHILNILLRRLNIAPDCAEQIFLCKAED